MTEDLIETAEYLHDDYHSRREMDAQLEAELSPEERAKIDEAAEKVKALLPKWEDGLVETPNGTPIGGRVLISRRVWGTRENRGGLLGVWVNTTSPSGEPFLQFRSFDFHNPHFEHDRRRPVFGLTQSGEIVDCGIMYLAGRSDAGMRHGRRWGHCR